MNVKRRVRALLGAAFVLAAADARADVHMSVVPVLGEGAPLGDAWGSLAVRLDGSADAIKGIVEVRCDEITSSGSVGLTTSVAPFSLTPGAKALLRIPVSGARGWQVIVTAKKDDGTIIATETMRTGGPISPLLVDVSNPSRLVGALRSVLIRTHTEVSMSRTSTPNLSVGSVWYDETTGDPVMPERAAEYGSATAVVIASDTLVRLGASETEALAGFVLAGGTLAISIARPEDLRHPTLVAFAGGDVHDAGPAPNLANLSTAVPERSGSGSGGHGSPSGGDDDDAPPLRSGHVRPSAALRDKLETYAGGNLVTSDFGATAPYGLGEVHFLPCDLTHAPALDEPWTQGRLSELVRHAWDRRATVAFLQGGPSGDAAQVADVRKVLDPNEGAKWTVLVSAMLLIAYAVLAGPVNFGNATRVGKPLRALRNLPIFSAIMFAIIVAMGMLTKGIRGQARRVSLVEASGGMTRGTIRRYRGLFTSRASSVTIEASAPTGVVEIAGETGEQPKLAVERGGVRLENVATLPWQTIVAREDDIVSLGGGVALVRNPGGDVTIVNRTGRNLRAVIASIPHVGAFFHAALADGASVTAGTGKAITLPSRGGTAPHALSLNPLAVDLERAASGLTAAWSAIESAASTRRPDYWPDDVPVVIAQIDGGDGVNKDAGLAVDKDRALLRVVGYGGVP